MGRFGYYVIDADGHGGEPLDWRRRIPDAHRDRMIEYVTSMKRTFSDMPGGGMQVSADNPRDFALATDPLAFDPPMREGMSDPAKRLDDMDLEGIDVTVMFPPGSGEEWALGDPEFAAALCRTLNDARAEYASYAPERLKLVAKLPMLEPELAAAELERCVTEWPDVFVGMVTAQHVLERNLDDPVFDAVWAVADRHGLAVCTHGGGQAPGQVPIAIDRYTTRLEKHAITHPLGGMLTVMNMTVGGVLTRFPNLRLGIMEAGVGWLPFWLERLDEHVELMPEQSKADRMPSEFFRSGRGFIGCEPSDRQIPIVCAELGDDVVCYSSDYCHWDCAFPETVKILAEREDLSDEQKRAVLAGNPGRLFGLPVPAVV
jgi:predicted TIM-barrel fold metal-dependent hydrolase